MEISLAHPEYLLFLGLIPLLVAVHFYSLHFVRQKAMRFANFEALEKIVQGGEVLPKNRLLLFMRILTLTCFTLATTGALLHYETIALAYEYVLAVDTSSSMLSTDFSPDRITAVREAAFSWLADVPASSRIGVVKFSTQAEVLQPPTSDLSVARSAVGQLNAAYSGGTAICEAVMASTNQLLDSKRPRAIILISDGQNNAGCPLEEGVAYAKKNNVTIFPIGIGSESGTLDELKDVYFTLDAASLQNVSIQTGGEYRQADDAFSLVGAFSSLRKTAPKEETFELTAPLMILAFVLVFIDWGLSLTRYRALP